MKHKIAGRKLGLPKDMRRALLRSLVAELFLRERITTTVTRAKEASSIAEKVITFGKGGTIHHRQLALAEIPNKEVVSKVFDQLSKRYSERAGGYTRILKMGTRKGDGAPTAILELVP